MGTVVDFHTHILPRMDDGSRSAECSLEMLRMEAEQGIERVVLTPHFYANHDSPRSFLERRNRSEEALRGAIKDIKCPQLLVGAEVHYFEGMSDSEYLAELAVQGTNCILVELPMGHWDERLLLELGSIYPKHKIYPVVAHLDRYTGFFHTEEIFEEISRLPVKIQANAGFFTRRFSRKKALKLLANGKIHLLGSDCHNNKVRVPNLGTALNIIERELGESAVRYINSNEKQIGL